MCVKKAKNIVDEVTANLKKFLPDRKILIRANPVDMIFMNA
jgi:malate/lactate dehydrogenase